MISDSCVIDHSVQVRRVEFILDNVRVRGLSTAEVLNKVIGSSQSNNSTAMHQACRNGSVGVIRSLIAAGGRWDIPNSDRKTAKEEAYHLKTSKPDVFRKIMVLMAEPMPSCPPGHRWAFTHTHTHKHNSPRTKAVHSLHSIPQIRRPRGQYPAC